MAIRSISRWEFEGILRWRRILENFTGYHVEWFADDSRRLLGVVYEGRGESDWSHVILERDERGTFQVRSQQVGVESQDAARSHLLQSMGATEKCRHNN